MVELKDKAQKQAKKITSLEDVVSEHTDPGERLISGLAEMGGGQRWVAQPVPGHTVGAIDLGFHHAGSVQCPLHSAESEGTTRLYAVQLDCTAILLAATAVAE
jgi:hypothetical protein